MNLWIKNNSVLFHFFIVCLWDFCYKAHVLTRKSERQKSTNHLSGGMTMPQSLLLSPLNILGTHTHAPGVTLKPQDLVIEQWSATWDSAFTIMQPAGAYVLFTIVIVSFSLSNSRDWQCSYIFHTCLIWNSWLWARSKNKAANRSSFLGNFLESRNTAVTTHRFRSLSRKENH